MGRRTLAAMVIMICVAFISTGRTASGRDISCGGSSIICISGRVCDLESKMPAPVDVRVYGTGGELLSSTRSLDDGSWSSSFTVPSEAGMIAVQAGGSGYFIRTVFVRAFDGVTADIKVVSDDLEGFCGFAYRMAHTMARSPRFSRFAPGLPAKVAVFEENPFNGSLFDPATLRIIHDALLDPGCMMARLLGKDILDVVIVPGGEALEMGPGMVFIVPDKDLQLLGLCTWAYDEAFDTLAAYIGLSTRLEGEFMVKSTLMHEMAHVVFPNDADIVDSVLSMILLQDRYTEYDLRCSLVANEPSFTAGVIGYGDAGPSDYLANILGTEWGSFIAPEF
ncbi:MAG TPA: hypothetical protein PLM88_08705 [Bacillota bacterium]|nr:hypothetical protein [Bacillota bacterium]